MWIPRPRCATAGRGINLSPAGPAREGHDHPMRDLDLGVFPGGARGTRTPDPLLAKEVDAPAGPAAAQFKCAAGCAVNNRESPCVTPLTGTGRARPPSRHADCSHRPRQAEASAETTTRIHRPAQEPAREARAHPGGRTPVPALRTGDLVCSSHVPKLGQCANGSNWCSGVAKLRDTSGPAGRVEHRLTGMLPRMASRG
jgi:hypothetical protein